MNASQAKNSSTADCYELRFRSLFHEGRGWAFPCDARGRVDMDTLGDRVLRNYLYARSMIGREVAVPHVQPTHLQ